MQQRQGDRNSRLKVKEYRGELTKSFDEILSAVGDYFDLFKNNTDKLEDLWLQLLDFVKVKNTNQCRIFKEMHYSIYIKKVIKNDVISKIIEEATRWVNTDYASKQLQDHLDKIRQIENEAHFLPDSYENFPKQRYLEVDLNEFTRQFLEKLQRTQ